MSILKLAETIEMSMDIPESDKKIAAETVMQFEKFVRKIGNLNKHLNALYNPFKEHKTVSEESVMENRGAIWKYLKQIKENFEESKAIATVCLRGLDSFSSDTHTSELINTFSDDFGGIEDQVISLNNTISNWDHPNYKDNVIKAMENLKKEIAEMKKLIYDRIIDHINTNILAKNWVDKVNDEISTTIDDNKPLISRLYDERESQLKDQGEL